MDILISNIVIHLVYFIGVIFLIGFLISLLNRMFYRLLDAKMVVCYATGFIGTPIHELSHALMCLVFFHRIHEIKLFQIDTQTGVLGYVNHSYNRKNVYQRVGNYFIGIAPILVGTVFLCLVMYGLLPDTFAEMQAYLNDFAYLQEQGVSLNWFLYAGAVFAGVVKALFADISVGLNWWIFMILALCVAIHMNLSGADIKGSLSALPILITLIVGANIVLYFLPGDLYGSFVGALNLAGSYLTGVLVLSLILSVFSVVIAAVVSVIGRMIRR